MGKEQGEELERLLRFINQERESRKWTQNELGEKAGLGSGTVSRIMTGQTTPSLSTIQAIMHALGYSLDVAMRIMRGEKDRPTQLVELYQRLDDQNQEIVLALIRTMIETQRQE